MTHNEMRGNISSEPLWEVISAQRLSEMWHSLSSTRLRHWSHLTSFASCFLSFEKTEGKKCSSEFIVGLGKRSVHRQLPAHLDWWSELNPMPPDRTQTSSSLHHPPWDFSNHSYSGPSPESHLPRETPTRSLHQTTQLIGSMGHANLSTAIRWWFFGEEPVKKKEREN